MQKDFEHGGRRWLLLVEAHKMGESMHWDLTVSVREWVKRGRTDVLYAFGQGEWDVESSGIVEFELVHPDLEEVPGLVEAASRTVVANDFDNAEWLQDWRMRPPGLDGSIGLEVDADRLPRAVRLRRRAIILATRERAYA